MINAATRILSAAVMATLAVSSASAQQTTRVRGTIEGLHGNMLVLKASDGASLHVALKDNAQVVGVVKATLADIKEGSFIGSGALPQADGTQKAVEVHIFPEAMRGTGEGHRPWDGAPNSTMTNGTVGGATVTGVESGAVTVKYKDGEKKIIVAPGTPIVRYEIGGKDDLKAGASVTITAAVKKPDGSFEAARVNVGRNGVVPN
jgi:hypothetical protein